MTGQLSCKCEKRSYCRLTREETVLFRVHIGSNCPGIGWVSFSCGKSTYELWRMINKSVDSRTFDVTYSIPRVVVNLCAVAELY